MSEEVKHYIEEELEVPEEYAGESLEAFPEEVVPVESAYDLVQSLVLAFSDSTVLEGQVGKLRSFKDVGMGPVVPYGVLADVGGIPYQLAIKMAATGSLVEEARVNSGEGPSRLIPEEAFQSDLIAYLQGEAIPGLQSVLDLSDVGDPSVLAGVTFTFDDGSEFRVYILGSVTEIFDSVDTVDGVVAELETKADQECLKKLWAEYYKYYSGKYISAAMVAADAKQFAKSAKAYEMARDGFEKTRNVKEFSCLEAWRAEMADKAKAAGQEYTENA